MLIHCQKRQIHLGVNKLKESFCPLKWGQILGMAEKKHLALWRAESQIFPSTSNTVPFCGSYWNYTFLWDAPDFLLQITSCSPSVVAAASTLRVTSSTLTLHLQAAYCWLKEKAEERVCLELPHIVKSWQNMQSAPSLLEYGTSQAEDWACLLPSSTLCPHHMGKPGCKLTLEGEETSLEQTQT